MVLETPGGEEGYRTIWRSCGNFIKVICPFSLAPLIQTLVFSLTVFLIFCSLGSFDIFL